MVEILPLAATTSPEFLPMLPQPLRSKLQNKMPGVFAWGAIEHGRPIGLVLAADRETAQIGSLDFLYVDPSHRHHGVGSRLLSEVEQKLGRVGCQRLVSEFLTEEYKEETEGFLRAHGFAPTEEAYDVFTLEGSRIEKMNWFYASKLQDGFVLFPWSELSPEDRGKITRGCDVWYPSILSPFQDEHRLDFNHSVGIRHDGDVVGWLLTERLASNMLLYKTLFIKESFQNKGLAMEMAIEMIREHRVAGEIQFGTFIVKRDNAVMQRIVRRRLAPMIIREKVLRRTQKAL